MTLLLADLLVKVAGDNAGGLLALQGIDQAEARTKQSTEELGAAFDALLARATTDFGAIREQAAAVATALQTAGTPPSGGGGTSQLTTQLQSAQTAATGLQKDLQSVGSSDGLQQTATRANAATAALDATAKSGRDAGGALQVLAPADVEARLQLLAATASSLTGTFATLQGSAGSAASSLDLTATAADKATEGLSKSKTAHEQHSTSSKLAQQAQEAFQSTLGSLGGPAGQAVDVLRQVQGAMSETEKGSSALAAGAGTAGIALGALAVGAVVATAHGFLELSDNINDATVASGLSISTVQAFQYLMATTGESADGAARSLGIFSRNSEDLATQVAKGETPTGKFSENLDKMGISVQAFAAAKPEERFAMLADGISRLDGSERAAALLETLGRGAIKLGDSFNGGNAAIVAADQHIHAVGASMDGTRGTAESLYKAQADLNLQWVALEVHLGGPVVQVLTDVDTKLTEITSDARKLADALGKIPGLPDVVGSIFDKVNPLHGASILNDLYEQIRQTINPPSAGGDLEGSIFDPKQATAAETAWTGTLTAITTATTAATSRAGAAMTSFWSQIGADVTAVQQSDVATWARTGTEIEDIWKRSTGASADYKGMLLAINEAEQHNTASTEELRAKYEATFNTATKAGDLKAALDVIDQGLVHGNLTAQQAEAAYRQLFSANVAAGQFGDAIALIHRQTADAVVPATELHTEWLSLYRAMGDAGDAPGQLQLIADAAAGVTGSLRDARAAYLDLTTKPSSDENAARLQLDAIKLRSDEITATIAASTPALQHIADLQRSYDQALSSGASPDAQATAYGHLRDAIAQVGGPLAEHVAAIQHEKDGLDLSAKSVQSHITVLQDQRSILHDTVASQDGQTASLADMAATYPKVATAASGMKDGVTTATQQTTAATKTGLQETATTFTVTMGQIPGQGVQSFTVALQGQQGALNAAAGNAGSSAGGALGAGFAASARSAVGAAVAGLLGSLPLNADGSQYARGPNGNLGATASYGGTVAAPVESGPVTQPYGPTTVQGEPLHNGQPFHEGIDYGVNTGTPVRAVSGGKVLAVSYAGNEHLGTSITIDLGNGLTEILGHLSQANVTQGQAVTAGETVGLSGGGENDPGHGFSSGPHLHYQIDLNGQAIDPADLAKYLGSSVAGSATAANVRGAAGLLPASWYAAIQANESQLPLPSDGSPQPMFGFGASKYAVGSAVYHSEATDLSQTRQPNQTRQALFPSVAAGIQQLDETWQSWPDAVAAAQRGDFPGFLQALAAHGYAGPSGGTWPGEVLGKYNAGAGPIAAFSGGGASATGATGGGTPSTSVVTAGGLPANPLDAPGGLPAATPDAKASTVSDQAAATKTATAELSRYNDLLADTGTIHEQVDGTFIAGEDARAASLRSTAEGALQASSAAYQKLANDYAAGASKQIIDEDKAQAIAAKDAADTAVAAYRDVTKEIGGLITALDSATAGGVNERRKLVDVEKASGDAHAAVTQAVLDDDRRRLDSATTTARSATQVSIAAWDKLAEDIRSGAGASIIAEDDAIAKAAETAAGRAQTAQSDAAAKSKADWDGFFADYKQQLADFQSEQALAGPASGVTKLQDLIQTNQIAHRQVTAATVADDAQQVQSLYGVVAAGVQQQEVLHARTLAAQQALDANRQSANVAGYQAALDYAKTQEGVYTTWLNDQFARLQQWMGILDSDSQKTGTHISLNLATTPAAAAAASADRQRAASADVTTTVTTNAATAGTAVTTSYAGQADAAESSARRQKAASADITAVRLQHVNQGVGWTDDPGPASPHQPNPATEGAPAREAAGVATATTAAIQGIASTGGAVSAAIGAAWGATYAFVGRSASTSAGIQIGEIRRVGQAHADVAQTVATSTAQTAAEANAATGAFNAMQTTLSFGDATAKQTGNARLEALLLEEQAVQRQVAGWQTWIATIKATDPVMDEHDKKELAHAQEMIGLEQERLKLIGDQINAASAGSGDGASGPASVLGGGDGGPAGVNNGFTNGQLNETNAAFMANGMFYDINGTYAGMAFAQVAKILREQLGLFPGAGGTTVNFSMNGQVWGSANIAAFARQAALNVQLVPRTGV